jgi:hypothetical protein
MHRIFLRFQKYYFFPYKLKTLNIWKNSIRYPFTTAVGTHDSDGTLRKLIQDAIHIKREEEGLVPNVGLDERTLTILCISSSFHFDCIRPPLENTVIIMYLQRCKPRKYF